MESFSPDLCGATNRDGQPCQRLPAAGQRRCHFHGGAPGSGGHFGNSNALKHGYYSQRVKELAADILAASDRPLRLRDEIALLRAVLARAATTAPPEVVDRIVGTLGRLVSAEHRLSLLDHDSEPSEQVKADVEALMAPVYEAFARSEARRAQACQDEA